MLRIPRVIEFCQENGIEVCSFYAFSKDNWNRSAFEIRYLKRLTKAFLSSIVDGATERELFEKTNVRFIGEYQRFGPDVTALVERIHARKNIAAACTAVVALGYSSRSEIVEAGNQVAISGKALSQDALSNALATGGIPDPDMIVRTGNTRRLSDFLLWQAAYAELHFLDIGWPDLDKDQLLRIVEEYRSRDRKFGR